ncbi:MAG: FAD-dependent oxidoreductase [Ruminococcaceae bacterium]|nr:FAD-dependent oxidoreductase [Oscillospiraceae bacterium]
MYDIIIIGAGPAGLSAALYASRAGRSVLVLERMMPGGQLPTIPMIENYPPLPSVSGPELAMQFLNVATAHGAEIRYEDAVRISLGAHKTVETAQGNRYEGKALILATGAEPKQLGLPDEEKLRGRGVSYCATCDGALFKDKEVAIVGSSSHTAEEAMFLSRHASTVHMLCPLAVPKGVREIKNIRIYEKASPTALLSENGKLCGIRYTDEAGTETELSVDALFVAVGMMPANRLCTEISLTKGGYIPTDSEMLTETDGVFAAGDIREKKLRQIVTAASDGATAAVSALRYIKTV